MESWDWKWIIGSVMIPVVTFVIGLFVGKGVKKRKTAIKQKAEASVPGYGNLVVQNSTVGGDLGSERAIQKESQKAESNSNV